MDKQKCFKCDAVKPLSDFYKHPRMKNGRIGKCKECNKIDVRENRAKRLGYYRKYDRERGNRQLPEYQIEYREKYPEKSRAHRILNYHVRVGNMSKKPCEVCGTDKHIHGHHDDYSKPLDVRWLCAAHHKEHHAST